MADTHSDDNISNINSTADTEPATKHDVGIGGGLGAVGGAVVGMLAGGPIGAVIGAVVGGAASAGAVDVVDKHDHDYDRTAHGTDGTVTGTTTGTGYPDMAGRTGAPAAGYVADTADGYTADAPAAVYSDQPATLQSAALQPAAATTAGDTLQLREEELTASKQSVQSGEVTLHKDVITETRTIDVPVTREELVIERHAVSGGQAVAGDFDADGGVIRIPLSEEQVTLEKTAVVTGEVSVGKRQVTETQHLAGTVRREEARVETTDGAVVVERDGSGGAA